MHREVDQEKAAGQLQVGDGLRVGPFDGFPGQVRERFADDRGRLVELPCDVLAAPAAGYACVRWTKGTD